MVSDMYKSWTKRCWRITWSECDGNHQSWNRTLDQLSYNVKLLLKKLIIKDMMERERQRNRGTRCTLIIICYSLSVFICLLLCRTMLRVRLGRGNKGSDNVITGKIWKMGVTRYKLQLLL